MAATSFTPTKCSSWLWEGADWWIRSWAKAVSPESSAIIVGQSSKGRVGITPFRVSMAAW